MHPFGLRRHHKFKREPQDIPTHTKILFVKVKLMKKYFGILGLVMFLHVFQAFSQRQGSTCPDDLFAYQDKTTRLWGYVDFTTEWVIPASYIKALPFRGKRALVMKGNKWGAIDCQGFMHINAEYDDFSPFNGDRVWVKKDGLWGLISDKGQVIVRPQFSEITIVNTESNSVWVKKGDLWGIFSANPPKMLLAPQFISFVNISSETSIVRLGDSLGVLNHSNATYNIKPVLSDAIRYDKKRIAINKGGQWGLITEFGGTAIETIYDTIIWKRTGLVQVKKGNFYGLMSYKGDTLTEIKYDYIGDFVENFPAPAKLKGKWGYVTNFGKNAIVPQYEVASSFFQGLAIVQKAGKSGLIDRTNKVILPLKYDSLVKPAGLGSYLAKEGNTWEFIGYNGSPLGSGSKYEYIESADTTGLTRIREKGKYGFFNVALRKSELPATYDNAIGFYKSLAIVMQNGVWGVINVSGTPVIPMQFESVSLVIINGKSFYEVEKESKKGLFNAQGKQVVSTEYELIAPVDENTFKVVKNKKYGVIKADGEAVVDLKYDHLSNRTSNPGWPEFPAVYTKGKKTGLVNSKGEEVYTGAAPVTYAGENLYITHKDDKAGLLRNTGVWVAEPVFDAIRPFADKLAAVKQAGNWGFMSVQGKINIPATYEEAGDFYKNSAVVKLNSKWGVIDKAGKLRVAAKFEKYQDLGNGNRILSIGSVNYQLTDNFRVK